MAKKYHTHAPFLLFNDQDQVDVAMKDHDIAEVQDVVGATVELGIWESISNSSVRRALRNQLKPLVERVLEYPPRRTPKTHNRRKAVQREPHSPKSGSSQRGGVRWLVGPSPIGKRNRVNCRRRFSVARERINEGD